jgi:hypothetical protein
MPCLLPPLLCGGEGVIEVFCRFVKILLNGDILLKRKRESIFVCCERSRNDFKERCMQGIVRVTVRITEVEACRLELPEGNFEASNACGVRSRPLCAENGLLHLRRRRRNGSNGRLECLVGGGEASRRFNAVVRE